MKKRKWYQIVDLFLVVVIAVSVIVFILMPFLAVFRESFVVEGEFSLVYFQRLFTDQAYLLKNSLTVAGLTTLIATVASVAVALYYFLAPKWSRKLIVLILGITMISPPFITALSYINLFGRRGLITYELLHLSLNPYGMWGIVLMEALGSFSLNALVLIGYLENMDLSTINSARSLGASTNHIIKDILLPGLRPGINVIILLTVLGSLSDFGTPAIIGGSYNVLATESYFAIIGEGNLAKAAALNVVILIPALLMFLLYAKGFKTANYASHGVAKLGEVKLARTGGYFQLARGLAVFFLAWISLQYGSIILAAFTKKQQGHVTFTLANFAEAQAYINDATLRSIGYSLIAALVGSLIGLLIGYYLKIRNIRLMQLIDFSATLPYIIPGTFFGLGYILAFKDYPLKLTGTALIVILNLIFKQLPFSTKVGTAAMAEINQDTLNAVVDLGGNQLSSIRDVILPLSRNALTVSFANAFTSTMTTIGSIIFLVTPSTKLLTLVLFEVVESSKYNVASVIALVIMIICVAVNALFMGLNRKEA